eukprot:s1397_g4.t2
MIARIARAATASRGRVGLAGAGLTAGAVGLAAASDEGFRRCLQFWIVVLPIFAHYKFVDGILHPSLDEVFADWSTLPIGSASIGQVYLAQLRSSRERVAVKVQMPGAEHLFRVDIKTLKLFTSFAFPWAVDHMSELEAMFEPYLEPSGVTQAYVARWRARAWQVWQRLQGIEDVNIPRLMETLMTIHAEQVFSDGLFNADPHPGNVLLLKDTSRLVGLIDFGQVKEVGCHTSHGVCPLEAVTPSDWLT